jgi:hypothetical protein
MNVLLSEVETALKAQKNESWFKAMIALSHRVIAHLLETESLEGDEKEILYRLVEAIHGYKDSSSSFVKYYTKANEFFTSDYKIARELVFKFHVHNFSVLKKVVNHYHFDGLLVAKAIEQMADIDAIKGLVAGIEHAQATYELSQAQFRQKYFERLATHANEMGFNFKVVECIVSSSILSLTIRKGMAEIIIQRNLLDGLEKDDREQFLSFYNEVLCVARDTDHLRVLAMEFYNHAV